MDKKLSDLIKEGFKGIDVSLDISLFDYGFAWKENENGDYVFYYGVRYDIDNYVYDKFDYAFLSINTNPKSQWDWVEWHNLYNFVGETEEQFFDRELPFIVFDLVNYYGYEEIFGSSYNYYFTIEQ